MKRKALVQLHRTIVPIRALPAALAGMRILHLSDLHLSAWTKVAEETRRMLCMIDYDLLLVTGDFSHHPPHWEKTLGLMAKFFDPIASGPPIYAVLGNHDLPEVAEHHHAPIRFLRNESTIVRFNGAQIRLAGVEQTYGLLPASDQARRDLQDALANPMPATSADATAATCDQTSPSNRYPPTILLAHFPSTAYTLPAAVPPPFETVAPRLDDIPQQPNDVAQRPSAVSSGLPRIPGRGRPGYVADLILSGHTHGGQIRVPGLGCLWANDAIPLGFARGLHRVGDILLHTSAGIGVSGPLRLRLHCPPELTLLSLQPQCFVAPTAADHENAHRPPGDLIRV